MKSLFTHLKKYIAIYIIGMIAMIGSITLDMFNPLLIQRIIDKVIIGKQYNLLNGILIILAFITIGRAILGFVKEYMFDFASSGVIVKVRGSLFSHIQRQSFSFFDKINTGELMSRMKEDTENIMNFMSFGIMLLVEQLLYFVIASVILFTLDFRLALISLTIMPVIAYLAVMLEKQIGKTYEKISDQRAVLNTTAQENLAGVRLVKSFGREKHEIGKFLKQNEESSKLNVEQSLVWAKFFPLIDFLTNIVIVLIICAGGYLVIGGGLTIGTLVAFYQYIFMLIWPMRMIGFLINMLSQCRASLKKIDQIFDEEPDIKSPKNAFNPEKIDGQVEFREVSLVLSDCVILKNISFVAASGSTIAIMGETGSGKSSLINLIGRYHDATSGSVLVDGIDVRDYDLQALRNCISVVMQDVFLFSDSIKENILFGFDDKQGLEEVMKTASKDAHIHEFIKGTSDGYSTTIGERGIGLSGGQKQRISIARAIARDSKILILDDSTSSLDLETEHRIQDSIKSRIGLTKIIVAHRVSAAMYADEILYLRSGEIHERGTHEELLQLNGDYYETYKIQCQGLFEDDKQEDPYVN